MNVNFEIRILYYYCIRLVQVFVTFTILLRLWLKKYSTKCILHNFKTYMIIIDTDKDSYEVCKISTVCFVSQHVMCMCIHLFCKFLGIHNECTICSYSMCQYNDCVSLLINVLHFSSVRNQT